MGLHPKVPFTQRLECCQMLDVVGVEVLELKAEGPQDDVDESTRRH